MDVGRQVGDRLRDRTARHVRAEREHAADVVARDREAVEQDVGKGCERLRGERRACEQAESTDACTDDLDLGQQLAAHGRADTVGADEHIAVGSAPVRQQQAHTVGALLEPDGVALAVHRVVEAPEQDLSQRPPVDRGVRALALVRRPHVRHRRQLVAVAVDHDGPRPRWRRARRLEVELEQVVREAGAQRLTAVGVHVEAVAGAVPHRRIALVDGAADPGAAQPLGEAQPADTTAGDQHVEVALRLVHGWPLS